MGTNKNSDEIKIRIPTNIKEEFQKVCDEDVTNMSNRIKQYIVKDINRHKKKHERG
jgi:hypothetical protein